MKRLPTCAVLAVEIIAIPAALCVATAGQSRAEELTSSAAPTSSDVASSVPPQSAPASSSAAAPIASARHSAPSGSVKNGAPRAVRKPVSSGVVAGPPALSAPAPTGNPNPADPPPRDPPSAELPAAAAPTAARPLAGLTCAQETIDATANALHDWESSYRANETATFTQLQCQREEVFCVNRFGQAVNDQAPDHVTVGRTVAAYAIVPSVDTGKLVVATSLSAAFGESAYNSEVPVHALPVPTQIGACELTGRQKSALKAAAVPVAKLASKPGLELLGVPAESWADEYWASTSDAQIMTDWTIFVGAQGTRAPGFVGVGGKFDIEPGEVLSVDVSRTEKGAGRPCAENHYEIAVDQGRYYLELAVLAPFAYRGRRVVQALPTVGSRDLRLSVEEDWHVTPALAVDYFPGGRQRGQLSSFRRCRTRSCIENWAGVQFGVGLGSPFAQWYVGLVLEPVSGFNLGFGAALLKGDFLPPGRAQGMVVPLGDNGSANSNYMFRPYIGIAITQDVINAIERASSAARQLF